MVAPVIVIIDEGCDGRLEVGGQLIGRLVHIPLESLVVLLQLAVGLRMEVRCEDVLDYHHSHVVPEGSRDIARAVVAQQPGAVC